MIRRILATGAVALLATMGAAAPAAAAGELTVRVVDTTAMPEVRVVVRTARPGMDPGSFQVRENGRPVEGLRVVPVDRATSVTPGVVLAIDTSGTMDEGGRLDAAKRAAVAFLDRKPARTRMAIVAFSERPVVVTNFTDDATLLRSSIAGLRANGETALWDSVVTASGLFAEEQDLLPSIVVLSGSADTVSAVDAEAARARLRASEAKLYAVALEDGAASAASILEQLVAETGGTFAATRDPGRLEALFGAVHRSLTGEYELSYASSVRSGTIDLQITAGALAVRATTTTGSRSGEEAASAHAVVPPPDAALFDGPLGRALVFVLVLIAGAFAVLAASVVLAPTRTNLDRALGPYLGGRREETGATGDRTLASLAIVRRAVEATASLARDQGLLDRLEDRLDQADLKLRAAEALFFTIAFGAVVSIAALVVDPFLGLVVAAVAVLAPAALLQARIARRRKAFTSLLPDTLQLLSSSLRAGYSIQQAFATVAAEAEEPMARELGRVVAETQLGRPLEEALDDTAARMGSADFDWAVMAIRIQREVGGNLAELLTTVAETMVARERLRREVASLTAEGRLSGVFLTSLPFVVGAVMYVRNPGYVDVLFSSGLGKAMLVGSAGLLVAGSLWMRKIIQIDI